jgi:Holliday junction DNA helicase RuvA
MIGYLKGVVEFRDDPFVVVDVQGVGYKVLVSKDVLAKAVTGEKITLFIYTHVREDSLDLYGFLHNEDLKLFEYLIGVSGVGPKTAVGIFSIYSTKEIVEAIMSDDVSFFTSVPRLGKKNAQKIIIELKNKIGGVGDLDLSEGSQEQDEIALALKAFGFSTSESLDAIRSLKGNTGTTEQKIKLALKYLGS